MKLILHIGTEKTGTTSLQRFCHTHRAALGRRGVLWPDRLGGENHRLVSVAAMSPDRLDEFARGHGIDGAEALDGLRRTVRARLSRQIGAAKDAAFCLISSEHLHSRLGAPEEVGRVRDLARALFERVEVLVHLRPQIDVAVSLASTQSRVGGAVRRGFFDRVTPANVYYDYDRLVGMWEDAFGPGNVTCLPFRDRPDILPVIAERTGIDLSDLPAPARLNEALDVQTMAMVNALVESGQPQRIDFRVLDRLPVRDRLAPDLLTAQGVQARFVPGNQRLIARRPDLAPGQLQPDWSRYPETGNLELLDSRSGFPHALARLVAEYNSAIAEAARNRAEGPQAETAP